VHPTHDNADRYDDRPLYYGLLCFWGTLVVVLALHALSQPLPMLLPDGTIPDRIVVVWSQPPTASPAPPAASTPGEGDHGPSRADAGRIPRRTAPLDAGGPLPLDDESLARMVGAAEDSRDHSAGPSLRGAVDVAGVGDRLVGRLIRLGGGRTRVAAIAPRAPRRRAALLEARKVGPPTVPAAIARTVIRARRRDIRDCHAALARRNPSANGRALLALVVTDGRVTSAEIVEDSVGDKLLTKCLLRRARLWRFPADTNGTTRVPLVFAGDRLGG
jgi:hypothetical protein